MLARNPRNGILSGNALKIIAAISMLLDHIGVLLFPDLAILRYLGRIALPVFAFMIAEGCRHTRSMGKYLGTMALFALVCQAVDYFATGSLYMSILVTFTLSIGLIFCYKKAEKRGNPLWVAVLVLGLVVTTGLVVDGLVGLVLGLVVTTGLVVVDGLVVTAGLVGLVLPLGWVVPGATVMLGGVVIIGTNVVVSVDRGASVESVGSSGKNSRSCSSTMVTAGATPEMP